LQKIARLVDTVEAEIQVGCPKDILAACELFAKYRGQWLKVAGLEKAEILEAGIAGRPLREPEVVAEFGAFIGYTAVRLGAAVQSRATIGVISLEVSPVHVCVSRHMLDLGWLSQVCEVKAGQAKDALPRLVEEFGGQSAGFCFMDHRGTIFHQDFGLLEKHDLFARRARFVADNTLNPGAPVFLWERLHQARPAEGPGKGVVTRCMSLTEFLAEHEDWTSVSDRDL
ncbi:unnamed protein product, partial [Polarella glacialis]